MRVLVVNDDPAIRELLRDILGEQGYRVTTAGDGLQALARLRVNTQPTVVLLDDRMPYMDGPTVLRTVAEEAHVAARSAFVLVSAAADAQAWLQDATRLSLPYPVALLTMPCSLDVALDLVAAAASHLPTP